jgi:gliding motility-associated-like protein
VKQKFVTLYINKSALSILKSLLSILFLVFYINTQAQLEADNWTIAGYEYTTFNGASFPSQVSFPPTVGSSGFGSLTQSDKNGKLLFFMDAGIVYDRNFKPMPSSFSSNGNVGLLYTVNSSEISQPTLCVPYPNQDSMYIIFHINSTSVLPTSKLYYSIIDLRLNNGNGDVVPGFRNIPLFAGQDVQYKLTAALHCNKNDVWVMGHFIESDKYFSILIDNTGVSSTVNYFTGSFIPSPLPNISWHKNNMGCMKVSALGNRMAANFQGLSFTELWDFNNSTGLATNMKLLTSAPPINDTLGSNQSSSNYYGPYGIEFSPSGNLLYISTNYNYYTYVTLPNGFSSNRTCYLNQYDLTLSTQMQIQASQFQVKREFAYAGAIQLANNGKLYMVTNNALSEIPNPENYGNCGFNLFFLVTGYSGLNLPIFLQSYFRYPIIATGNCQFQNISFSIQNPVGVSSVVWDFGDPASGVNNSSTSFNPTHIFSTQGSYLVKAVLQNANGCGADTIRKLVYAGQYKVYLGKDTSFCKNDTLTLKMKIPLATNTWSNGSTDTLIKITQPGTYWVKVKLGECIASDTIVVTQNPLPQFSLGADTVICNNATITLAPNPNYINSTYTWSNGTSNATNTVSNAGLHWLQLTDSKGCKYRDSITISFKTLPNYSLGNDTAICQKDTITLNATVAGATNYTWNTTATTATIKAFTTNTYWCDVNKEGCIYRDSINLLVKPLPLVNLGKDTTICEDKTYLLNATNPNASYLWQDASTNPTYLVTQAGTYHVKVTMSNCINRDTTIVQYQLKPKFTLGQDKLICPSLTYTLNPQLNPNGISFLWQDGSTDTTLKITQAGLYYLDITNYCGTTRDSILVTKGLCKVYVPTAFTPNNDNINDVFKIGGGEAIKDFTLTVFNRWGAKVYTTTNTQNGWNGTVNSKAQPTGAYIYNITYKDAVTNEVFKMKGTVVLIR